MEFNCWCRLGIRRNVCQINASGKSGLALRCLNVSGNGELIFSGSNRYHGGTTVNAGTLYVTNSAALPSGTSLKVGPGGTFDFEPAAAAAPIAASPLAAATVLNPPRSPSSARAPSCCWRARGNEGERHSDRGGK